MSKLFFQEVIAPLSAEFTAAVQALPDGSFAQAMALLEATADKPNFEGMANPALLQYSQDLLEDDVFHSFMATAIAEGLRKCLRARLYWWMANTSKLIQQPTSQEPGNNV
jgi:hypothetical protein